jgi:hypothetical protein
MLASMTIAGIVIVAVGAYLLAGWRIAVSQLPRAWAVARRDWPEARSQRGSVKAMTFFMFLGWPYYLAYLRISARLGEVADAGDPVALAAKVAERDRRIAQLERELGYPPSVPG